MPDPHSSTALHGIQAVLHHFHETEEILHILWDLQLTHPLFSQRIIVKYVDFPERKHLEKITERGIAFFSGR